MPTWTLLDASPTQGRTFQRPLDALEFSFHLEGLFNGTTDSIQHSELRLLGGSQDAHLFSASNIVRAWVSTKRRFPLVGATVRGPGASLCLKEVTSSKAEDGDGSGDGDSDTDRTKSVSEPHFVVREHDLSVLRPCEIVFGEVASAEEAQRRVVAILNGPRPLSQELLAQLYVFRETDRTYVLHLAPLLAHCITDRLAIDTLMRCFLDTLARGGPLDPEPTHVPLEDRLAMVNSSMELVPVHLRSLNLARQRWRRAVGIVILSLRLARMQGGHTLPCRLTHLTPHTPARSGHIFTSLTHTQSATVFSNCHVHKITFGSACLVLAQLAMTRVLYRRYLRGEIPEEEWTYRQRQPHFIGGPVNVRPYLDKEWFDRGGGGEFMLSISFLYYRLPFMTLGRMAEQRRHGERGGEGDLSDGAPVFSDLLTFDRFLHRAGLIGKQTKAFISHPLFYEIIHAVSVRLVPQARLSVLRWMERAETGNKHGREVLSIMDMPTVRAHAGSSLGNIDLISPSEYPLPPSHPLSPYSSSPHPLKAGYVTPPTSPSPSVSVEAATTPKIVVESTRSYLRMRPGQLYLGASTWRGQLSMFAHYDNNVFEEEVVQEWVDEVRQAVLWYLGRSHPESRHAQQSRSGLSGDRRARVGYGGGGGRARL